MKRISTPTRAVNLFGAGKDGFKNGDLASGVQPTNLDADWFNQTQEEMCRMIEGAGIVIDGTFKTQLLQAVRRMCGGHVRTVAAGHTVLTADDAGLVFVDATTGAVTIDLPRANVLKALSFTFRRTDSTANSVTVSVAGVGDVIDVTGTSFNLTASQARKIVSDGDIAWYSDSVGITQDAASSTYAPINSPGFTGTPTVPTAAAGTNTTQVASTAFVQAAIAANIGMVRIYDEAPINPPLYQLYMVVPPPDVSAPVITAFVATSGAASPIPITAFTATDDTAVTGYWIGEVSSTPSLADPGWSSLAPTSYATDAIGNTTLYARVRDAAGNISPAVSETVLVADSYYDVNWPYNEVSYIGKIPISSGFMTTLAAIPFAPTESLNIKSVLIPLRRESDGYPGTGTVQLTVRSGAPDGTILATSTVPVFTHETVETKTFNLPGNLTLAAGTPYFFTLNMIDVTGGTALYRLLVNASSGLTHTKYDSNAWATVSGHSALRLEKA